MGWFGKRRQEERDNVKTKELHEARAAAQTLVLMIWREDPTKKKEPLVGGNNVSRLEGFVV